MNSSLKNKVAVVTGGSRGIGRAIVLKLASLGANVVFSYLQNETAAVALQKEVEALGVLCYPAKVDVKNFSDVVLWMDQVKEKFDGRIDILVNNAGVIRDKALMMMAPDDWQEVVQTNLTGTFNVTKSCIVTMMKQKKGNIINISSVSGIAGLPRQVNYSASKGGINAFTKALAKEVAGFGIRVNAIAPGYIETEMLAAFSDEQKQKIIAQIPLQRIGTPEDVANCAAFLLEEDAQYITGQVIQIDGGLFTR